MVAEVVYVLEKVYRIERTEISLSLEKLFEGDTTYTFDLDILTKALEIFSSRKIDFVDTLLCGYSLVRGNDVKTFDKRINKYILAEKGKNEKK